MLIHLDLDYQNIDQRDEPYRHPSEMFTKLEPIYRATTSVLHRLGLPLLALITGRGYHFTGRVPLNSDATERLAAIAPETPSLFLGNCAQTTPPQPGTRFGQSGFPVHTNP